MEQNKMTPTPWSVSGDKENSELWIEHEKVSYVIASLFCEPLDDQTRADAKAIVTAVNSTYGAGIDPESVPELLELVEEMDRYLMKRAKIGKWAERLREKTTAAIEKATIK